MFFPSLICSNCSAIAIPCTSNFIRFHQRYFDSRIHYWNWQLISLSNIRFVFRISQSLVCLYQDSTHMADKVIDNHMKTSNLIPWKVNLSFLNPNAWYSSTYALFWTLSFLKILLDKILDSSSTLPSSEWI